MTDAEPDPKPKPLPVRVPRNIVERIDRLRGLVPRETYVRELLFQALRDEEKRRANLDEQQAPHRVESE